MAWFFSLAAEIAATKFGATEFAATNLHFCSRFGASGGSAELRIEVGLEDVEARGDRFGRRECGGDGVGGFQAVTGDADDGSFLWLDAALCDEFLGDAGGHAARGFGENAFGFGKQLDGGDDLGIGDVLGPAA